MDNVPARTYNIHRARQSTILPVRGTNIYEVPLSPEDWDIGQVLDDRSFRVESAKPVDHCLELRSWQSTVPGTPLFARA